jgi:DHA1 family tetracycline resistance protein-like MFS transporter
MAPKQPPLLTPLMRWFLLAMILANIAGSMTNLLMPLYLGELGASVGQIGLVFTLTSVVILALQVLGGWISDTIGRLRAIAIGSIGGVLGFVFMLFASSWQWMILALAINQIPYALVGPSFSAFIAENSSEQNRGKVYGLTDTIYQVVGVVGPPLGGLLAGRLGFKAMLLAATLFYASAAGLRIWMARTWRPAGAKEPQELNLASFKHSLRTIFGLLVGGGVITWIFLTDGVRDIGFRLSGELEPVYLEKVIGLPLEQIGLLGSFFSVAMMVTPMLSGRIADRYGERTSISAGFLVMFGAFLVFLEARAYPWFILTWLLFGAGVGLLSPAYQSLISKVVPQASLGAFSGLFNSSIGFLSLPAPWLGAQLWERFSPRLPFQITALGVLLTIAPVWLKFKPPKAAPATIPETASP